MKPKNQRLTLLVLAIAAVLAAVLLAMSALKGQASYFYAPGDLAGRPLPVGRAARIGGMVKKGSVKHLKDGVTIDFTVRDETPNLIRVRFRGIPPDLFQEESGVVAQGRFQPDGLFVADEILAKHDENYMPPQLDAKTHEHKTGRVR
ncbi:MAG: cytochrome c-type biosis protein CcmE [Sphingomonadales bacterium]|jgi:cytochrome c-type biogenesis protein CcmE|nr:cytochrome c-type biosis protein CcmE [Sphingomonadales bacterium]